MYRLAKFRFGSLAVPGKGKPAEPKPLKVIEVDFPLPQGMTGSEHRFNSTGTVFHETASLLKKSTRPGLVGGILRNEELQLHYPKYMDQEVTVAGWVKTNRKGAGGAVVFVDVNDGTHPRSVQVVLDSTCKHFPEAERANTAYCVRARGLLTKSLGQNQPFELKVEDRHEFKILGVCDNKKYPISAKFHKP